MCDYLVQLYELGVGPGHLDGDLHDVLLLRHDDPSWLHRYSAANGKTEILGTCGIYMKYIVSHLRTMWPKWTRVCTKNESPSFDNRKVENEWKLTVCKSHGCLVLIQQRFQREAAERGGSSFTVYLWRAEWSWNRWPARTGSSSPSIVLLTSSSALRRFPEDKEASNPSSSSSSASPHMDNTVWCWVFCTFTGLVWLTAQPTLDLVDGFCILSLPASKRKLTVHNSRMLRGLLASLRRCLIKKAVLSDDKNAADTWMSPLKHPSLFGGNSHGLDGRKSLKG